MRRYDLKTRMNIEDGVHLTVSEHTVENGHPLHWHSFFEIEIILDGSGRCAINDNEYDIEGNNVFFLTSTDFHRMTEGTRARLVNISFDEEIMEERDIITLLLSNCARAYKLDGGEYERMLSAAGLLRHECESGGECRRELLHYVISMIISKNRRDAEPSGFTQYGGIKKAMIYMQLHFREKITLSTLAAEAGYHPAYFSELFKKVTGKTYIDALNKLRVGSAAYLLSSGFSVTDACYMSGFGSLSNFGAIFKKLRGVCAADYKKGAHSD